MSIPASEAGFTLLTLRGFSTLDPKTDPKISWQKKGNGSQHSVSRFPFPLRFFYFTILFLHSFQIVSFAKHLFQLVAQNDR